MALLSIIIPTRDRFEYLIDTVQLILAKVLDAEVVVCDNSSTDRLKTDLASVIADGRVRYSYSTEKLSVVDNFERALDMSSGEYVIFIGDDDAIGPKIYEITMWAKKNRVEALVSYRNSFIANYFWPGVKSKYFGNGYASRLFVSKFSGRVIGVDALHELQQVASQLGGGLGSLPRAYHGLISRQLIERVKNKHGQLFGGVSPDIFSATLIASECNNACIVDFPFVVPGASNVSTAGQGAERSDKGDLHSTDHIARFGSNLIWDPRIPEFYSPQTVWAYSLIMALKKLPGNDIKPSFGRLYARCFLYYRPHHAELFRAMRFQAKNVGLLSVVFSFSAGIIGELLQQFARVSRRILHPRAGGASTRYSDLHTVSQAYQKLSEHIEQNNLQLDLPIKR
jgi:glycosyltransferase involved in cell wall biosynthesis